MKLIFTLLIFATLFNYIFAEQLKYNSFSIKGDVYNCELVVGTSNKCVSACGKSFSIERKFMSSKDLEHLYIFKSYDNEINCKKGILGTNTEFDCSKGTNEIVDSIKVQCVFSSDDEIKARNSNTLINAQINEQISQQQHQTHQPKLQQSNNNTKSNNNNNEQNQQTQQSQQQNTNEEHSSSSALVYSVSLIIVSLSLLLL